MSFSTSWPAVQSTKRVSSLADERRAGVRPKSGDGRQAPARLGSTAARRAQPGASWAARLPPPPPQRRPPRGLLPWPHLPPRAQTRCACSPGGAPTCTEGKTGSRWCPCLRYRAAGTAAQLGASAADLQEEEPGAVGARACGAGRTWPETEQRQRRAPRRPRAARPSTRQSANPSTDQPTSQRHPTNDHHAPPYSRRLAPVGHGQHARTATSPVMPRTSALGVAGAPEFAMDSTPRPLCVSRLSSSSLNLPARVGGQSYCDECIVRPSEIGRLSSSSLNLPAEGGWDARAKSMSEVLRAAGSARHTATPSAGRATAGSPQCQRAPARQSSRAPCPAPPRAPCPAPPRAHRQTRSRRRGRCRWGLLPAGAARAAAAGRWAGAPPRRAGRPRQGQQPPSTAREPNARPTE